MSRRRRSSFSPKNLESSRPVPLLTPYRVWLGLIVIGIAALSYLGMKNYRRILPGSDRSYAAILEAQKAVQRNFPSGIPVHFAPRQSTKVEPGRGGFEVRGWLEAASADGKISQTYAYSCTVRQNLLGNWSVTNLDLNVIDAPVALK